MTLFSTFSIFQTDSGSDEDVINYLNRSSELTMPRQSTSNHSPRALATGTPTQHRSEFVVRHKDDKLLENRDFSTFMNPKPRRSRSPTRRSRSTSPSKRYETNVTSESIPGKIVSNHIAELVFNSVPNIYKVQTPRQHTFYSFTSKVVNKI